jgi:membrane-associated protein
VELVYDLATGAYSLDALIRWGGYVILVAIVFTETGLLVGCFLPGDSLLITAGLVAATGALDPWVLIPLLSAAAIIGDSVGYAIGARLGPRLFTREKSLLFNPKHIERTRIFYERHGAKTIVIARFVPIVRTFAPVVAGVGQMNYRRFLAYNIFGGTGWVVGMVLTGYVLGQVIPNINSRIHIVVAVVIVLSVLPIVVEIVRERRKQSV